MRTIITLSALLAFSTFASAEEAKAAEKGDKQCPSACTANSCEAAEGTLLKIAVTGLDKAEAAASAEVVLGAQAAISYCKSCPESGTFTVKYNPEKTTVADIEKTLTANGLNVTGQKADFKIKGMMCQSCSNHLTTVLGKTEGVLNIDKISHLDGQTQITFDPKKTDAQKIKTAINSTKYKVVDSPENPAPTAPQS
jgi:P-type Cu+ transporter